MGDHTETLQIDFDSNEISYNELLDLFWKSHTPENRTGAIQYKSIIFYHTEEQKNTAVKEKLRIEEKMNIQLNTEIRPLSDFYPAEPYHQKYFLQLTKVFTDEFKSIYPNILDFINSTAAARINGYCKGYGNMKNLHEEIANFGLSEKGKETLVGIVRSLEKVFF